MNGASPSVRPAGERGLLLELDSNASVHAVARAARERFGDGLAEVVPGHTTVLLVWREALSSHGELAFDLEAFVRASAAGPGTGLTANPSETLTITVAYDGPDLGRVAEELGVSVERVIELHSGTVFTVAFMGFAPGFPYLIADAQDEPAAALLALPRLASPRTDVPAGAVAVAAGYCGIYPRRSPGGWNLLGRTEVVLFDAGRGRPALLEPGMGVRFVAS